MISVIEKLDNNEQVLLMYLADELPAEDRLEVQQLLEVDGSLRHELEQLQFAHRFVGERLAQLDHASPLPVSIDFAARQIGREMRQRLARPKAAPAATKMDRAARSWRWLYPTVAAASIAIIAMVWLGRQASPVNPYATTGLPHMPANPAADPQSDANVALLLQSLQPMDDEPRQVALADGLPQDDVSQYLLEASTGGK
jgi:anti-sigma factor RsiW